MNSLKEAAERSGITQHLIKAVLKQISDNNAEAIDTLQDVFNHGADGGFPGFTYVKDTVAFYEKWKKEIVGIVEQRADDLGENPFDFVAGFNCLAGQKGNKSDYYRDIGKTLYGKPTKNEREYDDYLNVANALAWFILEETARAFYDY